MRGGISVFTSYKETGAPECHLIEHPLTPTVQNMLTARSRDQVTGCPGVYPGAPNQFPPLYYYYADGVTDGKH